MKLSEIIKLYPTKSHSGLIKTVMTEYISIMKRFASDAVSGCSIAKVTTADVRAGPSDTLIG